jgi:DNA-binding NarL/FixJ family response regulator
MTSPSNTVPDLSRPDVDAELRVFRVVVLDPRQERRTITSLLVRRSPRLDVVGVAGNLAEARPLIRDEHADVALVEIQMPVDDGLAAIGVLRHEFPALRIVVSSFHRNRVARDEALARGADSYLDKPLQIDDLISLLDLGERNEPRPGAHPAPSLPFG